MSQWEFQVLFGVTVPGETGVTKLRPMQSGPAILQLRK
jgi:hypothetical protein